MNILIDSNLYSKEIFGSSFDFLLAHGLIKVKIFELSYKVSFVGEVMTPYDHFIALPKNFEITNIENIELVKSILKEFKSLKKESKLLIRNKTYSIGREIDSEFFYWKKLYTYFTDYITYGFYYPKKKIIKHSVKVIPAKINPMLTDINRDRYGNGITYEITNYQDDDFRNIFYTILKHLEAKFASEIESNRIKEIEIFLRTKKIAFGILEFHKDTFLSKIKTLQTNAVHHSILKTVVNFLKNSKIEEKNTINVFYTKEFEYLCEYLLRKVLSHNISSRFFNWIDPEYKKLRPDIITHKFIADAKYYRIDQLENSHFEKELYAYNIANDNSVPNFVIVPSERNTFLKTLIHKHHALNIVSIDFKMILKDFHTSQHDTEKVISGFLIQDVLIN